MRLISDFHGQLADSWIIRVASKRLTLQIDVQPSSRYVPSLRAKGVPSSLAELHGQTQQNSRYKSIERLKTGMANNERRLYTANWP
jgi:hypothetical protein